MQKEPHGEEWRHPTEQSKLDRALSATVNVRFRFWFLCQTVPMSRSTAAVKDTYISVTQTKKVCLRGKHFAVDDMLADSGMLVVKLADTDTRVHSQNSRNKETQKSKQRC